MLTQDQVIEGFEKRDWSFDSRDKARLTIFFSKEDVEKIGMEFKENTKHTAEDWTEENFLKHLASDLKFAFEKALNQRGLSASAMQMVIKMWLWILEDPLCDVEDYAYYGLPLLKLVAIKYNLPNEIGEDDGSEKKYDED